MRKWFVLLLLSSFAFVHGAEEKRLNLFIWSEYMDPEILRDFEREFRCRVVMDLYEDAEAMLAKLQAGGTTLYDVAIPPDYMVRIMIKLNLLAPLHLASIPNFRNLADKFTNPPYDPGNKFSVAYQWGTVGLYVRKTAQVDESWGLIFDPKKQPGPFVVIDSMRDLIGAALKYKGHSLNTTNPAALKEARDLLIETKSRCIGFENTVGGKNRVLARTARAAIIYSGEAARGISEDPQTYYFIPREGSQMWVDNMVIPAKAPHAELAQKFINFILESKVGARLSNFTQFSTPNQSSKPLIATNLLSNPSIYPPPEVMQKLELLQDLGPASRLYDEVWTQVKTR